MMNYELYHGDCLEIMPTLAAGSVDAVITDPPYGTTACKWDSVIPFEPMWAGIKHVIKKRAAVVLFGSQPFTSALVMSNVDWFKYEWIWDKKKVTRFLDSSWRPLSHIEQVCVFMEKIGTYNPQMKSGKPHKRGFSDRKTFPSNYGGFIDTETHGHTLYYPKQTITISAISNGQTHPTQKPVALMEYLIKTYTNPGDTVLDFTMGSGSTGVACMKTGRNFIGIELDAEYHRIAETRIKNAAGDYTTTTAERVAGKRSLFNWEGE
jgi:DNA modification methylase